MTTARRLALALVNFLFFLYPPGFRAEFGEEMEQAFSDLIDETVGRGMFSLLCVLLRELRDWPGLLLRAHWQEFLKRLKEQNMVSKTPLPSIPTAPGASRPASWKTVFLGMFPFFLFGLVTVLSDTLNIIDVIVPRELVQKDLYFWLFLVLLGLGVIRDFPRWAYPYLGFSIFYTWWGMHFELTVIRIFGFVHVSYDLWRVRAWLPFIFVILLALLIRRSWKPLRAFVQNLREDWTQYAFTWYGVLPLGTWLLFDEVRSPFPIPFLIVSTLALTGGAAIYLRAASTPRRVQALLAGLAVTWFTTVLGTTIYWHGRLESWMTTPVDGYAQAARLTFFFIMFGLLMFLPGIISSARGLFRGGTPSRAL